MTRKNGVLRAFHLEGPDAAGGLVVKETTNGQAVAIIIGDATTTLSEEQFEALCSLRYEGLFVKEETAGV